MYKMIRVYCTVNFSWEISLDEQYHTKCSRYKFLLVSLLWAINFQKIWKKKNISSIVLCYTIPINNQLNKFTIPLVTFFLNKCDKQLSEDKFNMACKDVIKNKRIISLIKVVTILLGWKSGKKIVTIVVIENSSTNESRNIRYSRFPLLLSRSLNLIV